MSQESVSQNSSASAPSFQPNDLTATHNSSSLNVAWPETEFWVPVLQCSCTFPPEIFEIVMSNLISNPNILSSYLFRADILFETTTRGLKDPRHLKPEYRPIEADTWPEFAVERTVVRQLIPRNPRLDRSLVQTCHFLRREDQEQKTSHVDDEQHNLVIYIPHVKTPEEMPFYHPCLRQLAFLHIWRPPSMKDPSGRGSVTVIFCPYHESPITVKLSRTALRLLQTIFKHGQGQLAGYKKRVHHDRVIAQKRFQDTYTVLKAKYAKQLAQQWVEVTDPGKHVFEDIGIAAFLVELWRDMYADDPSTNGPSSRSIEKPNFPGFVDIGCGNGVLVHILRSEGYPGWGFDARRRKTWSIFPPATQESLQQRILVPYILSQEGDQVESDTPEIWHDGRFNGEFIISNHADELTPWTPLLAFLNRTSFVAIPCCSHDLSGARSRLPEKARSVKHPEAIGASDLNDGPDRTDTQRPEVSKSGQVAEAGSLKRNKAEKKMPSAYSTLCSYVTSLAEAMEFKPEQEVLRIPSTRNTCILGQASQASCAQSLTEDELNVVRIVEEEMKREIKFVRQEWIIRANGLMQKPTSGH